VVQAGQYTIQIGAFRTQTSAVTMMNKLLKYGYDAYLSESMQGNMRLFRVRVGRYSSKALAHQTAARLQQSGFDTWITTQS
jgi:cell division protein FtsN